MSLVKRCHTSDYISGRYGNVYPCCWAILAKPRVPELSLTVHWRIMYIPVLCNVQWLAVADNPVWEACKCLHYQVHFIQSRYAAVLLMVENPFISRDIIAHARMRLHIADHGGMHSILTSVLQLKFDRARFQLNPGFRRQSIVNQCSIDFVDLQRRQSSWKCLCAAQPSPLSDRIAVQTWRGKLVRPPASKHYMQH